MATFKLAEPGLPYLQRQGRIGIPEDFQGQLNQETKH
jgi:hypothetical protein